MPAGNTYSTIATTTLGGSQTTVTFSSIPSTYTDLILVINAASSGNYYAYTYFNSDTGANYSRTEMYGSGTTVASGRFSNLIPISLDSALGSTINRVEIMNYSNTTTNKNVLWRLAGGGITLNGVGTWRSNSAINRIDVTGFGTTAFIAGSTFTLYGIAAA